VSRQRILASRNSLINDQLVCPSQIGGLVAYMLIMSLWFALAVDSWAEVIYAGYSDGRAISLSNFTPTRSALPVVVSDQAFPRGDKSVRFSLDRGA
jgi:hypothetical protein